MALAVYGKHPAKGDFLEYGVPEALKPALEAWLDAVLAEARAVLAAEWDRVWPNAPMLRFWIGDGIWGAPVAGVLAASQDRVGRRFPLVLLALGGVPPPVTDPDQGWYDAASLHLATQLALADLAGPADLLAGAPVPAGGDAAPGPRDFWAVTPGPLVAGLLSDIILTDHRRASETRSYWWVAGAPDTEAQPVHAVDLPLDEPGPAPEPGPEPEPEPEPEPGLPAGNATEGVAEPAAGAVGEALPEAVDWALPEADFAAEPEADASPFDAPAGGYGLFQPPEPGAAPVPDLPESPAAPLPVQAPRQLWSQVWAGPGLPSGEVLAWFFRGYAGEA